MREAAPVACEKCSRKNYNFTRDKKTKKEKLELNKYCPSCRQHTRHRETK